MRYCLGPSCRDLTPLQPGERLCAACLGAPDYEAYEVVRRADTASMRYYYTHRAEVLERRRERRAAQRAQ